MNLEQALQESASILMNTPFSQRRFGKHSLDYGDNATIGLHVKKKGYDVANVEDRVFGRFLGKLSDGMYYIGTTACFEFIPQALEVFEYESDMKELWRLD